MKIKIVTNKGSWSCANTGKGFFIQRLIKSLIDNGVEVTCRQEDSADIELGIGKFVAPKYKTRKRIVRIGPSHFDTNQDWRQLNKRKAKAVTESDGVIYQSKWAQRVGRIFLGDGKIERVIFNGHPVEKFPGRRLLRNTAVMSTRKWVPQKRLKNALQVFRDRFSGSPYKLLVLGDCDKKIARKFNSDNIDVRGPSTQQEVRNIIAHARFMLHPVWLDACPNSVVEALGYGCPVICSSQGGTSELIKGRGGLVVMEEGWDYKPTNLNKPLMMDGDMWGNAMTDLFSKGYEVENKHIEINEIADQYISFFEAVLNG